MLEHKRTLEHKPGIAMNAKSSGKAARHFLSPLYQTPSHLIFLLFAAQSCDSKMNLLAGQGVYLKYILVLHMVPII